MYFNVVYRDGTAESVTAFGWGEQWVATADHPNFAQIINQLADNVIENEELTREQVANLFDVTSTLSRKFIKLSERVSVRYGKILFDGDVVDNALAATILRYHTEGNIDFTALVCFMEKIALNPNQHSREQLFTWLARNNFGLAMDGDFIAYKGLSGDGYSKTQGTAIVNGELFEACYIPNAPGTIVEMPRSVVDHNPFEGCSVGLHIADFPFASTFGGGNVVAVKINPRDVVSVPTDTEWKKMRVCRYKVLEPVIHAYPSIHVEVDDRLAVVEKVTEFEQVVTKNQNTGVNVATVQPTTTSTSNLTLTIKETKNRIKGVTGLPKFYDDFHRSHWRKLSEKDLLRVAKLWEVADKVQGEKGRERYIKVLMAEAARRRLQRIEGWLAG